jgi:hypothetical protein
MDTGAHQAHAITGSSLLAILKTPAPVVLAIFSLEAA